MCEDTENSVGVVVVGLFKKASALTTVLEFRSKRNRLRNRNEGNFRLKETMIPFNFSIT